MSDYESLSRQLKAILERAAYCEEPQAGHLFIAGADAPAFLQRMLTNEVLKMKIGEGRYNAILDRKGMALSLFYLTRLNESEFYALIPPQLNEKTPFLLNKMKLVEKVTLQDRSREMGLLWLVGPEAESQLPQERSEGVLIWPEEIFGVPVWKISGPKRFVNDLSQRLAAHVTQFDEEARKILQMRAGFPEYGIDIDENHILLEAGVPYAYQRQKGCYPGQEVIERILAYGKGRTPRSLCLLRLKEERKISPKTEIFDSTGEKAGWTTSARFDPLAQETLVFAYLDHKYAEGARWLRPENDHLLLEA